MQCTWLQQFNTLVPLSCLPTLFLLLGGRLPSLERRKVSSSAQLLQHGVRNISKHIIIDFCHFSAILLHTAFPLISNKFLLALDTLFLMGNQPHLTKGNRLSLQFSWVEHFNSIIEKGVIRSVCLLLTLRLKSNGGLRITVLAKAR